MIMVNLYLFQDRCRAEIVKHIRKIDHISELELPRSIQGYLKEGFPDSKCFYFRPGNCLSLKTAVSWIIL